MYVYFTRLQNGFELHSLNVVKAFLILIIHLSWKENIARVLVSLRGLDPVKPVQPQAASTDRYVLYLEWMSITHSLP